MHGTFKDTLKSTLQAEFQSVSLNLASKSITDWGKWTNTKDFPVAGTWEEKLLFIDNTLEKSLEPVQHRPNDRMFWRTRPDLNKYRGWLLNKALIHQSDVQNRRAKSQFILPEDLPKIVDDLYLFHKNHKKLAVRNGADAGTLQHYKSLDAMSNAVKPYMASYPFSLSERLHAHKKYLEEYGGNGGARLIATTEGGTELIQLMSEKASIAYGSPRWCTAYRNEPTHFSTYKDDLLVVIDPDGMRWQFHFGSGQTNDEDDIKIENLPKFLAERDSLAKALAPYWIKYMDRDATLALQIPAFKTAALAEGSPLKDVLSRAEVSSKYSDSRRGPSLLRLAKDLSPDPDFQKILEPHLFGRAIEKATKEALLGTHQATRNYEDLWKIIFSIPAWKTRALEEGHFAKSLETVLTGGAAQHEAFIDMAQAYAGDPDVTRVISVELFDPALKALRDNLQNEDTLFIKTGLRFYKFFMADPERKARAEAMGLHDVAVAVMERTFEDYKTVKPLKEHYEYARYSNYTDYCATIKDIPSLAKHAREKGYFAHAVTGGFLDKDFENYETRANSHRLYGRTSRDYITDFLPNVLSIPEWRKHALKVNHVGKLLANLFAPSFQKVNSYYGNEINNPYKTVMFMMQRLHNQRGFREALTPYVARAYESSIGMTATHRLPRSRKNRTLNVEAEILKYSGHCVEWRQQITAPSIARSFDDTSSVGRVLELGKKSASRHWLRAVMASGEIDKFLDDLRDQPYSKEELLDKIRAHEPYAKAFARHL